ncbi:MAG: hypothetical protein EAX96_01485 [Candidatus Lokiarchaeota archaeon]|nr:hypothetical protein [Candidatus Lokiarchaeota archaeon]
MAVLDRKEDLITKIIASVFDLIERALLGKRFFKLIIRILNGLHLNYITKYLKMDMLQSVNI